MVGPSAAEISVRESLELLDGRFHSVAEGVAHGRYALWLGSGISRGRVDDLPRLIERVLAFLQTRATPTPDGSRFRHALEDVLALAGLSPTERARIDIARPVAEWNDVETILRRLATNYARLLDISIAGEAPDVLLWDAIDVRGTYANVAAAPDCEHLCICILAMEGAVPDIASANWDGLIEIAANQLSGTMGPVLRVCVVGDDLRRPALRTNLFKFHGCALRAQDDPATYRHLLIARQSQIAAWATDAEHAVIVRHLTNLAVTKPTLMIGLSAQDPNIQSLFANAGALMAWQWPSDPPAYVFAEDALGPDQRSLLRCVYVRVYAPHNSADIEASALFRAYAKPLLVSLVLYVIGAKLRVLIDMAAGPRLSANERATLQACMVLLRSHVAGFVGSEYLAFTRQLVAYTTRALSIFHNGRIPAAASLDYFPLTTGPPGLMAGEPALRASGLPEFAVALGVFGLGYQQGVWRLDAVAIADAKAGAFRVSSATGTAQVFLVANSHVALLLQLNGHFDGGADEVLVQSLRVLPPMPRSPRAAPGRTGKVGPRTVSIADLLSTAVSAAELIQRFREEVAL